MPPFGFPQIFEAPPASTPAEEQDDLLFFVYLEAYQVYLAAYTWHEQNLVVHISNLMPVRDLCTAKRLSVDHSYQQDKAACAGRGAVSCTAQDKGSACGSARRWRQGTSDGLETLSLAEFGHTNNLQLDSICLPKGAFAIYRRQSGPGQACRPGQLQHLWLRAYWTCLSNLSSPLTSFQSQPA